MEKIVAIVFLALSFSATAAGGGGASRAIMGHQGSLSGAGQADLAWSEAMQNNDVEAVMRCYAPDAVVWVTGAAMVTGRKGIRAQYEAYFAAYTIKEVSVDEIGSKTIGNDSVGWGTFTITTQPKAEGPTATELGRYTEVAKRVDGRWIYKVDHASDDPAPEPAAKP